MTQESSLVPFERIVTAIYVFRGEKVIMDRDLARLYGVPTKALKQAVRRNEARFPYDFMFELSPEELAQWRSQFVTSKAEQEMTSERPSAIGFQYVGASRSEETGGTIVREERACYRTEKKANRVKLPEPGRSHHASTRHRPSARGNSRAEASGRV